MEKRGTRCGDLNEAATDRDLSNIKSRPVMDTSRRVQPRWEKEEVDGLDEEEVGSIQSVRHQGEGEKNGPAAATAGGAGTCDEKEKTEKKKRQVGRQQV